MGGQPTIAPRKSLGQNFLNDANIARKIVAAVDVQPGESVVEIGPGTGALTRHLLPVAPNLVAVEIDGRAVALLGEQFPALRVVQADVLDVRLDELVGPDAGPIKVVGNLPYYITTPILFGLFGQKERLRSGTFMVQLEVAQRMVAPPGGKESGILSILTQSWSVPKLLFKVPPTAFFPAPKVTSAVIQLDYAAAPKLGCDDEALRRTVHTAFSQRRKTLRNALRPLLPPDVEAHAWPVDLGRRAETLSVAEFVGLTNALAERSRR